MGSHNVRCGVLDRPPSRAMTPRENEPRLATAPLYVSNSGRAFAFSRLKAPEFYLSQRPRKTRAQGRPGASWHPQVRALGKMHTGWTTGSPDRPAFPARMVLTVSFVLSSGSDALLPPSPCGWLTRAVRSDRHITAGLDAQTPGVRTTRLLRPRTPSLRLQELACAHTRSHTKTLPASCRTREGNCSQRKPPCNAARARRRRVHRCPARGS
ncbi:hypothetical protein ACVWY3_001830 [Bradyrhizobium sp. USDA 4486]